VLLIFTFLVAAFAQDCRVSVPPDPLHVGLSTPFIALAPCNQSDPMMVSFAQGSWIDTATGQVVAYNPLIITQGTVAAVAPTKPTIPTTAIVALWFGTNAGTLTLVDVGGSLTQGMCINGLVGSIFGQFAYCNAPNFFAAAFTAITAGTLKIPALGNGNDGQICPTTRSFFIVDMDQSDNVITSYVDTGNSLAQDTQTNRVTLAGKIVRTQTNGSDMRLCEVAVDTALGCTPWKVPDMADLTAGAVLPTFGTAELQAAVYQPPPIALTPITHAMTRVNNQPSLDKVNAYRAGCGQAIANVPTDADSFQYCFNLYYVGPKRIAANSASFSNLGSPDQNAATNLFAFLAQRYAMSFGPDGLNCASLLNVPPPIVPIKNMGGQFVGATITVPVQPAGATVLPTTAAAAAATTTSNTTTLIIIIVCSIGGALLVIGLIVGVIIYRRRTMYS